MIADIVVLASVALTGVFVAAWLLSPGLRAWIERPKYRFQDDVRRYDVAQDNQPRTQLTKNGRFRSQPLAGHDQQRSRP